MARAEQVRFLPNTVDSHTHLGLYEKLDADAAQTVDLAGSTPGVHIVDVGVRPSDLRDRLDRFQAPCVSFTSGLHPTSVDADWRSQIDLLSEQLEGGMPVAAIGELGMDFYHDDSNREEQHEALAAQIALADRYDLPIIVHNRSSETEILEVLRTHRPPGVMHCFSQDADHCRRCLDLGMHISFAGNLTYKNAESIREAARIVPDDRLLVETDAPFLSPQAVRGLPNHSGHLFLTIEYLASIRGTSVEAIAATTHENAHALFRLSTGI